MMVDSVVGVIEFGATARGDGDEHSDRDIFALIEDVDGDELRAVANRVAAEYGTSASSIACYSASSFDLMIQRGSLFTWHLKLEGRVLHDPDGVFDEAFDQLTPYDAFISDLARFQQVFDDVVSENTKRELDTVDAHVLYIVVRNVCMLLTAWEWPPVFGRRTVVRAARELHPSLPLSRAVAAWLEIQHLAYTRNVRVEPPVSYSAPKAGILNEVATLLAYAEVIFSESRQ
jgi:predicted nucleotidyltransferase